MKLLLDTHTFLWFAQENSRLSRNAKFAIEDAENDIYLSMASPHFSPVFASSSYRSGARAFYYALKGPEEISPGQRPGNSPIIYVKP